MFTLLIEEVRRTPWALSANTSLLFIRLLSIFPAPFARKKMWVKKKSRSWIVTKWAMLFTFFENSEPVRRFLLHMEQSKTPAHLFVVTGVAIALFWVLRSINVRPSSDIDCVVNNKIWEVWNRTKTSAIGDRCHASDWKQTDDKGLDGRTGW